MESDNKGDIILTMQDYPTGEEVLNLGVNQFEIPRTQPATEETSQSMQNLSQKDGDPFFPNT